MFRALLRVFVYHSTGHYLKIRDDIVSNYAISIRQEAILLLDRVLLISPDFVRCVRAARAGRLQAGSKAAK